MGNRETRRLPCCLMNPQRGTGKRGEADVKDILLRFRQRRRAPERIIGRTAWRNNQVLKTYCNGLLQPPTQTKL